MSSQSDLEQNNPGFGGATPVRITLCADDFGLNDSVDIAVLRLAELGRLSATSCLVQGESFRRNALALRDTGLQLGLHLNFTEPLKGAASQPLPSLIVRSWLRRLDIVVLRAQIIEQLDAFERAFDRAPDFIDGHQHIHQLPMIRRALLDELSVRYRCDRPWLRYTGTDVVSSFLLPEAMKSGVIHFLGARGFRRLALQAGFALNCRFMGVYGFQGGRTGYADVMQQWLSLCREGDLIMCHPALYEDGTLVHGHQRRAEFDVLSSPEMGQWLARYGLALN